MARSSADETRRPAVVDQLTRVLRSVHALIGDVQATWANALGLTVPQWNILVTIADAVDPVGISVKTVASALNVNPSFVVHQSRPLEDLAFIRRTGSDTDKRVVYLSITPKAQKALSHVAKSRDAVSASIKEGMGEAATLHTIELLQSLERCLARCRLRLQLDE